MDLLETVAQALEESERLNQKLDCFITLSPEKAMERARALSKPDPQDKRGKLHGVMISVKDNICTKGIRTTAGSAMLADYIPPFNATVIERIEAEGGIVIGKTAMDAFGFGTFSTNVGKGLPIPKNPHDISRSAGGSSGGAGSITAAAPFPHLALAENTGGSISAPAAFCGVVGFTPTYGKVSRYGLIDYAGSLDKIGTMGKTVREARQLAEITFGPDPKEESSWQYQSKPVRPVKRIGVLKDMLPGVDQGILSRFGESVRRLESAGFECEEVAFPLMEYAVAAYYILATSEASSNLARYGGMRYGAQEEVSGSFSEHFSAIRSKYFGPEEKRRIILGTFVRTAGYKEKYYFKALQIRDRIREDFAHLFRKYDALISPTMPILPPKFEEISHLKPIEIYALDRCTIPPSMADLPHLSVPLKKVNGLPAGLQIICDRWEESTLFEFGTQLEALLA